MGAPLRLTTPEPSGHAAFELPALDSMSTLPPFVALGESIENNMLGV